MDHLVKLIHLRSAS